jgi:three-Cys-motif partner protein
MMEIPWVIEEPTKIKHELLKQYVAVWMKILFSTNKKFGRPQLVTYFDGFSGPGEYYCDEQKTATCSGSPVLVAKIANDLIAADKQRKVAIFCIDRNKKCIDSLQAILDGINTNQQPWVTYQGDFEQQINSILDEVDKSAVRDYPMFFFVDPFGYSGFSMNTLKRILSYPRSEIFINYMVYDVVRFWEQDHAEQSMLELFGSEEYRDVDKSQKPEERQLFFLNLYCKNLHNIALAKYVMPFRVNTPGQGVRPRYYLIHVSQHFKALEVMKDNMARVSDVDYRFEAIGVKTAQMSLFEDPEKIELRNRIKNYCQEQQEMFYEKIAEWAYIETNGVKKTIKECLMQLEQQGDITIQRKPRQKSNTVANGAQIKYEGA